MVYAGMCVAHALGSHWKHMLEKIISINGLSICRGAHVVDFDQAHVPLSHLAAPILLQLRDPSCLDLLAKKSSPHAASLRNLRSHARKGMGTRAAVSWFFLMETSQSYHRMKVIWWCLKRKTFERHTNKYY